MSSMRKLSSRMSNVNGLKIMQLRVICDALWQNWLAIMCVILSSRRYICALANSADVARLPYFLTFCGALNAEQIFDAPCGPGQIDEQMYKEEESL